MEDEFYTTTLESNNGIDFTPVPLLSLPVAGGPNRALSTVKTQCLLNHWMRKKYF